jgi:hypothetical protein
MAVPAIARVGFGGRRLGERGNGTATSPGRRRKRNLGLVHEPLSDNGGPDESTGRPAEARHSASSGYMAQISEISPPGRALSNSVPGMWSYLGDSRPSHRRIGGPDDTGGA